VEVRAGNIPRGRRRVMGRLAAVLFLSSGVIVLVTLPLPPNENVPGTIAVGLVALAIGAFAWLAPWDRWPQSATLIIVPPAFALIAFGNLYSTDRYTYGVFFVIAFVWIGLAHRSWTSVAMAPLAAIAYILPFYWLPGSASAGVSTAAVTIPACVMIGEALSWGAARLSRTEEALREEREMGQRLRDLDQMKTTFMSAVSHELRTPITICRGHLDVLGEEPSAGEVADTVGLVLDELGRMARLVEDITMLVRQDDRAFLRREDVVAGDVMSSVARKVEPFLNGRLSVLDRTPGARLNADAHRLEQALVNLLHNAAVHTPDGTPVELSLAAGRRDWRFEVADAGPGVAPGDEDRVFEQFERGPNSPGSGLGLSVVRSIARAHGGEAGVINRPGKGATFWLTIPR
jgi:signal transduction histidine kinase